MPEFYFKMCMTCLLYNLRDLDHEVIMSFLVRSELVQAETTVSLHILVNSVMPEMVIRVSSAHIMWRCS